MMHRRVPVLAVLPSRTDVGNVALAALPRGCCGAGRAAYARRVHTVTVCYFFSLFPSLSTASLYLRRASPPRSRRSLSH
jgi:hypothetical protein